jgi:hypothetical protein
MKASAEFCIRANTIITETVEEGGDFEGEFPMCIRNEEGTEASRNQYCEVGESSEGGTGSLNIYQISLFSNAEVSVYSYEYHK